MAKIASSKPYGSGKAKTPTKAATSKKENEVASPVVRTSPRRRKSEAAENAGTEVEKEVQLEKKTSGRGKKPSPPKFSENKKKSGEGKTKSPGRGRRKSALEPVVLNSEPETEPVTETADEIDDIFKYVNHSTEEDEEQVYEEQAYEEQVYEEDYVESIRQREREESNLINKKSEENEENSPIFEVEYEVSGENSEDYEHETTPSDEEVAFHFDEDEIEDSEGSNSEALDEEEQYNDQFRYNSSNVRLRLAQYFQRQESAFSSASSLKNQLWTRMKDWVSENVIPSAKELGVATVEYTKKAIEQISKRLEKRDDTLVNNENNENDNVSVYENEPRIYEITEEEQEINDNVNDNYCDDMDVDEESDKKRIKLIQEEQKEEEAEKEKEDYEMVQNSFNFDQSTRESSLKSSYHSVPSAADETLLMTEAQTPQKPENTSRGAVYSEVMDSRITEIVLFFAKCTRDTPISSIYEHLEEFFTLKGESSLNFTEKQLVSSVIKDFLTEKDEAVTSELPPVPAYEPVAVASESPKRVKILSGSGIRFRAPKFTAEEEARLEELEQARQRNLAMGNNKISTLSTPQQRNKIQRKLLAPEMTVELIEGLPENRGKAANVKIKNDSVSSAIEDIISQKIKEAKQREEAERLETEKLKARVAELERESRERATKEALLQKQLEEQKKELEIEKAAAKEKLESLKNLKESKFSFGKVEKSETPVAAASVASVGFSFGKIGDEKPPVASTRFNFGEANKTESTGFKGFSFGKKDTEESKTEVPQTVAPFATFSFGKKDSEESKPATTATPFASFSFGKKETSEGSSTAAKSELNPNAPAFNFGVKKESDAENKLTAEAKPVAPSFGFSFGNATTEAKAEEKKEETPKFSFGAGDSEKKSGFTLGDSNEKKSGFTVGESKSTSVFNFGSSAVTADKSNATTSTFSFGSSATNADKSNASTPAFSFGTAATSSNADKPASAPMFNFGAKPVEKASGFSFGTSETAKSNGTVDNSKSNVFGSQNFNFGSSPVLPTVPSPQPSNNNPFAALNSATNIFSSAAPITSFGAPATFPPVPSANAFSFPPISPTTAPIIPMNFGSSNTNNSSTNDQPAEMAFQTGSRAISIPKRRRK